MIFNPGVSGGGLRLIASGEATGRNVNLPSPAAYVVATGGTKSFFIPPTGEYVYCDELNIGYTLSVDGMTLQQQAATPTGKWYAYGF